MNPRAIVAVLFVGPLALALQVIWAAYVLAALPLLALIWWLEREDLSSALRFTLTEFLPAPMRGLISLARP